MDERERRHGDGNEKAGQKRERAEDVEHEGYQEQEQKFQAEAARDPRALLQRLDRSQLLVYHEIGHEEVHEHQNDAGNNEKDEADENDETRQDLRREEFPEGARVPEIAHLRALERVVGADHHRGESHRKERGETDVGGSQKHTPAAPAERARERGDRPGDDHHERGHANEKPSTPLEGPPPEAYAFRRGKGAHADMGPLRGEYIHQPESKPAAEAVFPDHREY